MMEGWEGWVVVTVVDNEEVKETRKNAVNEEENGRVKS